MEVRTLSALFIPAEEMNFCAVTVESSDLFCNSSAKAVLPSFSSLPPPRSPAQLPLIVHPISSLPCVDNRHIAIAVICSYTRYMQSDSVRMVPTCPAQHKHVGPIWSFHSGEGKESGTADESQQGCYSEMMLIDWRLS
ncbi:hypothetical protein PAMA_015992 [Pampus argenteus]